MGARGAAQTPGQPVAAMPLSERLLGGYDRGETQTAVFEGAAAGNSYFFSISANRQIDPASGRQRASYSYDLWVDGRFVISGWVNGGQGPDAAPVRISLDFSYAAAISARGDGGAGGLGVPRGGRAYRGGCGRPWPERGRKLAGGVSRRAGVGQYRNDGQRGLECEFDAGRLWPGCRICREPGDNIEHHVGLAAPIQHLSAVRSR
jgi:hypothetical protein